MSDYQWGVDIAPYLNRFNVYAGVTATEAQKMDVQYSDWRATPEAQEGTANITIAVIVNPDGTWDAVPVIEGGTDADFLSGDFGARSYTLKAELPVPSPGGTPDVRAWRVE